MGFTINHSNYSIEADNDAPLVLESEFGVLIPRGNNNDKPSTPKKGLLRFNNDTDEYEIYDGKGWGKTRKEFKPVNVASSSHDIKVNEDYIGVNTVPCDLKLPETPKEGTEIIIKDETGIANDVDRITVTSNNSTIDGNNELVINFPNKPVYLLYANNNWRILTNIINGPKTVIERFKINYDSNGGIDSISDETENVSVNIIDSRPSRSLIDVAFSGYNYPPLGMMVYGEDISQNTYRFSSLDHRVLRNNLTNYNNDAFGNFSNEKFRLVAKESFMNVLRTGTDSTGTSIDWTYKDNNSILYVFYDKNGNCLYVTNDNNHVLCLDTNGDLVWSKNINNNGKCMDIDDSNNLYISNTNSEILKFDISNKSYSVLYNHSTSILSISYYNGYIYFSDDSNGGVGKISASDGSSSWYVSNLYNANKFVSIDTDSQGNVCCINENEFIMKFSYDSVVKWRSNILYTKGTNIKVDAQDNILACDEGGHIYCLDINGNVLWQNQILRPGTNSFERTKAKSIETDSIGNVFVGTEYSSVHKFSNYGDIVWVFNNFNGKIISLSYDSNNSKLYTGDENQRIKKLDINEPVKNPHAWVQFVLSEL